jgi:alanine racemase
MLDSVAKTQMQPNPYTIVTLSRSAYINNLREFQKLSPAIAPVLKSNAYGHGLTEVVSMLKDEKTSFIVVDSYDEASTVRKNRVPNPILIIGYIQAETINCSELSDISFAITSIEMLLELRSKVHKKTNVHLKIDTGMHRQGISLSQVSEAIQIIKQQTLLIPEGIYSHFSDANNTDSAYTHTQIESWNSVVKIFKTNFPEMSYFHISNSAGHGYTERIDANVTRPGMGLYGFSGNGKVDSLVKLKPVLELTTVISGIKDIEPGSTVGYNGTFISDTTRRIATVPVGYDTGLDRRLSNKGVVKVGNKFAKIIGIISMNTTIIDITEIENIQLNTPVIVISRNSSDQNSMMNIAKECNTIVDDIATGINPFIKRIIID